MQEPIQSIIGAIDNLAAAVAALLGILGSPMVRDPVFRAMVHTYCTGISAVLPPRAKTGKRR